MTRGSALLALLFAGVGSAAGAAESAAPAVTLEPPPGWRDVRGAGGPARALVALKGPESSSFVLVPADDAPRDSAAAVLSYLTKVLGGIRDGSGADFRAVGPIETRDIRGVTVQLLRATLDGKPRLIVALVDAGGPPLLATLTSAAPEAMLTPIFGALRTTVPEGAVRTTGVERSLDGQLEIALGGGLRARGLSAEERGKGVVLALQGAGSEVVFLKLSEEDSSPKDQAGIVRAMVADAARVPLDSVSPSRRAATAAGPAGVYAWAKLPGSPDLRFAAAFLPWAYWGYSLLARGPQADELTVGVLAALKAGPSAVPKLLADTPSVEALEESPPFRRYAPAAAAVAAVLLAGLAWRGGRKKGTLRP